MESVLSRYCLGSLQFTPEVVRRLPTVPARFLLPAGLALTARPGRTTSAFARYRRLLRLVLSRRRAGKPAWVRRRRSDASQSRHRNGGGVLGVDRRDAIAWDESRPRRRAEPYGHREVREPMVARRARERTVLALRAVLRHRVASGQGRARRQSADPDSRRPVRRSTRTSGTEARVRRGSVHHQVLR